MGKPEEKKRLIDEIFRVLKPLVESEILKLKKENGFWSVEKIEGTFDYQETKQILFSSLSIIRDHVKKLSSYSYCNLLRNRKLLGELDEEIYLYDKVIQAFLQALSTTTKADLNTKMRWSFEVQFLLGNHRLVTDSAHSLYEDINEKHIRVTICVAVVTLLVAAFSLIIN